MDSQNPENSLDAAWGWTEPDPHRVDASSYSDADIPPDPYLDEPSWSDPEDSGPPEDPYCGERLDLPRQNSRPRSGLPSRVQGVLRSVLSATHRMDPDATLQLVSRIQSSTRVLSHLSQDLQDTYVGVLEVLTHEASVLEVGLVNLDHLPVVSEYSPDVAAELAEILACVAVSTPEDPHAEWADLVEVVQRAHARSHAAMFVEAIDAKRPVTDLMEAHRKIEPPTTRQSVSRERSARTAKEVSEQARAASAGRDLIRLSSGMPTLDRGYTGTGEPLGFVSLGTFNVVMGPTGTGKTSFSYSVTPAFGIDLRNWGLNDACQVFFHTEEEGIDKIKGFRMDPGGKFHHLSDSLIIDAVGTSRRRMAETLYDLVISADEKARSMRRPITDFLPYIVQLDYIQSIQETGEDPTTATAVTAEFLLRGVAAWNPEEMAKFSGVDFREYAGMAWPTGMDHHRVAVIAYAQLVKISDETLFYKAGKRGVQLSDFVVLNDKDDPYWDVREGDLRLFGKNQMRGSGVIAQNAHSIVILHRSVPYNNPSSKDEQGRFRLADTRARILFDKSRAGSRIPYAPMRFDVQSTGFRAQYFDEIAERALSAGKLDGVDSSYTEEGDPMMPVRPVASPLASCRYA